MAKRKNLAPKLTPTPPPIPEPVVPVEDPVLPEPEPIVPPVEPADPPPAPINEDTLGDVVEIPDQRLTSKARIMREKLKKQPKVMMMVPLLPGESPKSREAVILNGYGVYIRKNVMVRLPEQIAKTLMDAYRITASAGKDKEIGRDEAHLQALS